MESLENYKISRLKRKEIDTSYQFISLSILCTRKCLLITSCKFLMITTSVKCDLKTKDDLLSFLIAQSFHKYLLLCMLSLCFMNLEFKSCISLELFYGISLRMVLILNVI